MDRCIKCGLCLRACPTYPLIKGNFPGPREVAAVPLRHPGMDVEDLLLCSMCYRCRSVCPSAIDLPEAMMRMRLEAAPSSREGHQRMLERIAVHGRSVDGPASMTRKGSGVLFFPGCVSPARLPNGHAAVLDVLDAAGLDPFIPEGLVCCGSPVRKIGEVEKAEGLRQRNLSILESADQVVASCPGCVGELNEHYGIPALHTVEALYEARHKLKARHSAPIKVALHHPCHLSRGVGAHTKEQSAQLLMALPGVHLVEMDDPSSCCGGGGGLMSGYPESSLDLATSKANDAKGSGAEVLVAACPFCVLSLRRIPDLKVVGLEEFILSKLR
jgi:Fe-S oxidoreductase